VQQLKLHLHDKSPKTVNNVLATLSVLLKTAVEWELIEQLPCSIRLLPVPRRDAAFHDFDAYERLLEASQSIDYRTYVIALLGGDGGLRVGEICTPLVVARSSEMPSGERAAGSGLQVLLETDGFVLSRKVQRHDDRPGPMRQRVPARTVIVPFESGV
jgi:hypothetical protein